MCGKCHKPRRLYEPKDKIKVTVLYLTFALGCFITSTLGVVAIGNFVNSSAQIVCGLEDFRVETLSFFDSMLKPVKKLSSITSTNIDKISVNLGNAGKVTIATDAVINGCEDYSANISAINISSYECTVCQSTSASIDATTNTLRTNVRPSVVEMELTANIMKVKLVVIKSTVIGVVNAALSAVDVLLTYVSGSWKTGILTIMESFHPVRSQIIAMGGFFFAIAYLVIAMTIAAIIIDMCGAKTNCTGIKCIDKLDDVLGNWLGFLAWIITFLFIIILFVLAGVMLPVGVAVSDMCVVMNDFPNDVDTYAGKQLGALGTSVFQGCFKNMSLFGLLNLTSTFNFKNSLSFGAVDNFNNSKAFTFDAFDPMHEAVHSLTYKNLTWETIDSDITAAENAGQNATADSMKAMRTTANNTVAWMKTDVNDIQADIENLENLTASFQADLALTKPYVNEILAQVDQIFVGGQCGFIDVEYKNVIGILCESFLESILRLSLYMFLSALFGAGMIFGNLKIQQVFGAHGEFDPNEDHSLSGNAKEMFGNAKGMTFRKMDSNIIASTKEDEFTESPYIVEGEVVSQEEGMQAFEINNREDGGEF